LEGWNATQAVSSSNLLNRLNLSPFIPEFHIQYLGSSLFSVGEVNQEVKIWNSRTQEIEAGKDVCRTTE
jgi:hypothetical protein